MTLIAERIDRMHFLEYQKVLAKEVNDNLEGEGNRNSTPQALADRRVRDFKEKLIE
jgi:hypothetical protein